MPRTQDTASTDGRQDVLDAVDALWQAIRHRHDEVPAVLLGWGRGVRTTVVPHLHSGFWSGTLTLADETAADADQLFATVLHEAAHALAAARNIADSSRNGKYHNGRYAAIAAELGLDVREHPHYAIWGWSETSPADATRARYAAQLADLRTALARRATAAAAPARHSRNNIVAVCGCRDAAARPIRMAPAKLALGPITCGICGQQYRERT